MAQVRASAQDMARKAQDGLGSDWQTVQSVINEHDNKEWRQRAGRDLGP